MRIWRIGEVAFCIIAISTLLRAASVVGPNLNLSQAAGNQYEAAVAINPNNNNQIFVVGRNETGGLTTARSSDGGVTWTRRMMAVNPVPASGDVPRAYGNASVDWDQFDNLFLTYLAQSSISAPTYVAVALSTDAGANFYSPTGTGPRLCCLVDRRDQAINRPLPWDPEVEDSRAACG